MFEILEYLYVYFHTSWVRLLENALATVYRETYNTHILDPVHFSVNFPLLNKHARIIVLSVYVIRTR